MHALLLSGLRYMLNGSSTTSSKWLAQQSKTSIKTDRAIGSLYPLPHGGTLPNYGNDHKADTILLPFAAIGVLSTLRACVTGHNPERLIPVVVAEFAATACERFSWRTATSVCHEYPPDVLHYSGGKSGFTAPSFKSLHR